MLEVEKAAGYRERDPNENTGSLENRGNNDGLFHLQIWNKSLFNFNDLEIKLNDLFKGD